MTVQADFAEKKVVEGDVNDDGVRNIADAVMLQNYLVLNGNITDWQAGDLCNDSKLDVFDLVLLKKMIIEK